MKILMKCFTLSALYFTVGGSGVMAGEPITRITRLVPEQRSTLIYLDVPVHFVGKCTENRGAGTIRTFAQYHTVRNGAHAGTEELIRQSDGSYKPANGEAPIPSRRSEPLRVGYYRSYRCLFPILTEGQANEIRKVAHVRQISPPLSSAGEHPEFRDTDLFRSHRYRDYQVDFEGLRSTIRFNTDASGGINPVLVGSSIGQIIQNPGTYGLRAFYHIINGRCGGADLVTNVDTIEKLNAFCSLPTFLRHADLATKGIGKTVLEAY